MASVSSTAREYFGGFFIQTVEVDTHRRGALKTPTRGQRKEFHTAAGPLATQFIQQNAKRVRIQFVGEKPAQFCERKRSFCRKQCGLEDNLRLLCVHVAVKPSMDG